MQEVRKRKMYKKVLSVLLVFAMLMTDTSLPAAIVRAEGNTNGCSELALTEAGLSVGTTYGTNSSIATFTVLEEMVWHASTATIDGEDYSGYVRGTNNPKAKTDEETSVNVFGDVAETGAVLEIHAVKAGTLYIAMRRTSTTDERTWYVVKKGKNAQMVDSGIVAETAIQCQVEAGETYQFYAGASKVSICVAYVTATSESGQTGTNAGDDVPGDSCTLTFDYKDHWDESGDAEFSRTVKKGETYGELPTPVCEGYEFLGWYTEAGYYDDLEERVWGDKVTADTICAGDSTIYARWKMITSGHIDNDTENGIDWSVDANGKLTVTGTGNYLAGDFLQGEGSVHAPWSVEGGLDAEILTAEISLTETTDASGLLYGLYHLTDVDLSKFDTSKVTKMDGMFAMCCSLKNLDLSHFDTRQVTSMAHMFVYCESLQNINLESFDTHNVTDISEMFMGCNVSTLDVSSFDLGNCEKANSVFEDASIDAIKVFKNLSVDLKLPASVMYNENGVEYTLFPKELKEGFWLYASNEMICKMHTITFMLTDGNALSKKDILDGAMYGILPVPTRDGYTFTGWYTAVEGGEQVTDETICTGNATVYAQWVKNNYIASDHIDNGTERGIDWAIDADGKLTIAGTGEFIIYNYDSDEAVVDRPWINYADQILSAEVDLSGTTNANEMFKGCANLRNVDLSRFDTSMLEVTYGMFYNCSSLTRVDLSAFHTDKVWTVDNMFRNCENLQFVDLSSFDFSNDPEGGDNLFSGCYSLETIKTYMNYGAAVALPVIPMRDSKGQLYTEIPANLKESLTLEKGDPEDILPVSGHVDNATEQGVDWKIEKSDGRIKLTVEGTGEFHIYKYEEDADPESEPESTVPWEKYASIIETAEVNLRGTTDAEGMFSWCYNLISVDLSGFDTGSVTKMDSMFLRCISLTDIDLSRFDTRNVTDMTRMFSGCRSLTNLDLSKFDTGNVTDMLAMFYDCRGLTSLDLSRFDTGNVTNMDNMFEGCCSLTSLDLSKFDTKNVESMYNMFDGCVSLKDLDVRSFDTSKVYSMKEMFSGCESLENLDISNFSAVNVESIEKMFYGCKKLRILDISGFQTDLRFQHVFEGCENLQLLRCFSLSGDDVVWFIKYLPHKPLYDAAGRVYAYGGGDDIDQIVEGTWLYTDRALIGTVAVMVEMAASPKTDYSVGEELDVTGGELLVTYDDGSTKKIALTKDMVSGFDTSAVGTSRITATYEGLRTAYSITVKELQRYTLTLDVNGGNALTEGTETKTLVAGTAYGELPTVSRTGYTFSGWYTAAEGGEQVTAETICVDDVTIYAHWTKNEEENPNPENPDPEEPNPPAPASYTLTFDVNGGDALDATVTTRTLVTGTAYGELPTVSRKGYTFAGWYTAAEGGEAVTMDTICTGDATVYAHWTEDVAPTPDPEPAPEPDPTPTAVKMYGIHVTGNAKATDAKGAVVTSAKEKDVINITWTPRAGYEFVKWTLTGAVAADATAATTSFTVGTKDITVSYEEKISVKDEVIEERPADADTATKVSKIKFDKTKLILNQNGAAVANPAQVTAASGAELPKLYYVTENADIVAVDQSGNFYPVGQGEATVTAYCGNKKATCKVTVVCYTESIAVMDESGADVTGSTVQMQGGEQAFFTVSFQPYDSTDPRAVTWKSDNKSVTVKNGIITAKEVTAETTAVITATVKATNPSTGKQENMSQTVNVKVSPITVEKASSADKTHTLALKKKSLKLTTEQGKDTSELEITVTSKSKELTIADGDFEIESCESTNENVVSVGEPGELQANGKKGTAKVTLTAEGAGTAYIIVKSRSSKDDSTVNVQRCKVTVSSPATSVSIESGSLNIEGKSGQKTLTMRKGESGTVEIVVSPEFTTDYGKVKLTGSGGITVKNGIITAKKVTKKPAKLVVKCGKLKEEVLVTVVK